MSNFENDYFSTVRSGTRRFARLPDACEYSDQFARFLQQPAPFARVANVGFVEKFEPVLSFCGFFLHDADLVDEVAALLGTIRLAVVRPDGCTRLPSWYAMMSAILFLGRLATNRITRRAKALVRRVSSLLSTDIAPMEISKFEFGISNCAFHNLKFAIRNSEYL
jgi:hypothetical protein